jgi:hypothetical protein
VARDWSIRASPSRPTSILGTLLRNGVSHGSRGGASHWLSPLEMRIACLLPPQLLNQKTSEAQP